MTERGKCAECGSGMNVTDKMKVLRARVEAVEGPKADVAFICTKCEMVLMGLSNQGLSNQQFN